LEACLQLAFPLGAAEIFIETGAYLDLLLLKGGRIGEGIADTSDRFTSDVTFGIGPGALGAVGMRWRFEGWALLASVRYCVSRVFYTDDLAVPFREADNLHISPRDLLQGIEASLGFVLGL
jgi:hypothetical protein